MFPTQATSSWRTAEDMVWLHVMRGLWGPPSYKSTILLSCKPNASYAMFNSGSSKLLEDNLNCVVFHIPVEPFHTRLNALCEKGLKLNPSCAWSQLNVLRIEGFAGSVTSCTNLITTLPESSISLTHHLQTGDDFAADHVSAGRILSSRTSSRWIWHWMMFQHSAKAIRARGKRWLLWVQYLHGVRFSSSLVSLTVIGPLQQ